MEFCLEKKKANKCDRTEMPKTGFDYIGNAVFLT